MKHFGIVFLILVSGMSFVAQPTYAQRINLQIPNNTRQFSEEPTPTPNKTAPTTTPIPTAVPTKTPIAPTATLVPQQTTTQSTTAAEPTPTPKFVSPVAAYLVTPTPKPKGVATTVKEQRPPTQVAQIIAAPLAIAKTVLPGDYYAEQRLDPKTTNNLLLFAGSSMLFGILLLAWPSLVDLKNRIFMFFRGEEKIVYLHSGKGLLKA